MSFKKEVMKAIIAVLACLTYVYGIIGICIWLINMGWGA